MTGRACRRKTSRSQSNATQPRRFPDGDLFAIQTLGFRGEALPSIGAVARLAITTRTADAPTASSIVVEAGVKGAVRPASAPTGTRIEVTDLFAATPARLKFLKSDRSEAQAVAEIVKRLAIAHPHIRFTLAGEHLTPFTYAPEEETEHGFLRRLSRVLGSEFNDNAMSIGIERDGVRVSGFAGLPTFHRGTSSHIHFVVNGRPVRDKLLLGAVRGAYADVMASDRHPILALMIELNPRDVDVNVHPAKTEVRFRDPAFIRGFVVGALKEAITRSGFRSATTGGMRTLESLRPHGSYPSHHPLHNASGSPSRASHSRDETSPAGRRRLRRIMRRAFPSRSARSRSFRHPPPIAARSQGEHETSVEASPLGAARAQVHGTYIVAQTQDGIVIVDQHAAHERLVYERLKRERDTAGIARQLLLIPEVVDLDPVDADRVVAEAEILGEPRPRGRAFRIGRASRARSALCACGRAHQGAGAGRGGCARRMGRRRREPGRSPPRRGPLAHVLPRLDPCRTPVEARGDERAPPRDGSHPALRPMQPRPTDLCGAEAVGYRTAVRAAMTS